MGLVSQITLTKADKAGEAKDELTRSIASLAMTRTDRSTRIVRRAIAPGRANTS